MSLEIPSPPECPACDYTHVFCSELTMSLEVAPRFLSWRGNALLDQVHGLEAALSSSETFPAIEYGDDSSLNS